MPPRSPARSSARSSRSSTGIRALSAWTALGTTTPPRPRGPGSPAGVSGWGQAQGHRAKWHGADGQGCGGVGAMVESWPHSQTLVFPPQVRAAARMGRTATTPTSAAAAPCESGSPQGAPARGWVPQPQGGNLSWLQRCPSPAGRWVLCSTGGWVGTRGVPAPTDPRPLAATAPTRPSKRITAAPPRPPSTGPTTAWPPPAVAATRAVRGWSSCRTTWSRCGDGDRRGALRGALGSSEPSAPGSSRQGAEWGARAVHSWCPQS